MTVKELIADLALLDQNLEVAVDLNIDDEIYTEYCSKITIDYDWASEGSKVLVISGV